MRLAPIKCHSGRGSFLKRPPSPYSSSSPYSSFLGVVSMFIEVILVDPVVVGLLGTSGGGDVAVERDRLFFVIDDVADPRGIGRDVALGVLAAAEDRTVGADAV